MTTGKKWTHKVEVKDYPSDDHVFRFMFPRGTLEPRMSAMELSAFLLPHLPHIIPLLSKYLHIQFDLKRMYEKLATSPKEVLDEILPWIQPAVREAESDVIIMRIKATHVPETRRVYA